MYVETATTNISTTNAEGFFLNTTGQSYLTMPSCSPFQQGTGDCSEPSGPIFNKDKEIIGWIARDPVNPVFDV